MRPFHLRIPVARQRSRGVAVIFVLLMLTLVSVLTVSFFATSQSEYESSTLYERAGKVDWLAQAAIDLAIAQLREGTTSKDTGGEREARIWASQPGAIRTFDLEGDPDEVYKLYSDDDMIVDGGGFDPDIDMRESTDWIESEGVFVNLNEELDESFPIVDPSGLKGGDFEVAGMTLTSEGEETFYSADEGIVMPVKWLYVLKDGTMAAGEAKEGVIAVPGASDANPLVGRIAFWADDESSKVNINTAGGDVWPEGRFAIANHAGAFHDTPRFSTRFEYESLDLGQPYRNEFQRYPGHPATTYLSAVFSDLTGEQLGEILPRLEWGGTKGGTLLLPKQGRGKLDVLATDRDRIYATVDELIFRPDRSERFTIQRERLESSKFYLTANSRSPDQTPFGTPRVSTWPVHRETGPAHRTPYDDLIAFSTEIRPAEGEVFPFHFTRADPFNPSVDFAGRNEELYEYLVEMLLSEIPGTGGSFAEKYGDHDIIQILTSIYDYIRCTNLRDGSTEQIVPFAPEGLVYPTVLDEGILPTAGFGRFETVSEFGIQIFETTEDLTGSVTVEGANLGEPGIEEPSLYERKWYRAVILWEGNNLAQGFTGYQQNHQVNMTGLNGIKIRVEAGENLPVYVNGSARQEIPYELGFPAAAQSQMSASMGAGFQQRSWGGALSPGIPMLKKNGAAKRLPRSSGDIDPVEVYPFASLKFFVDWPRGQNRREFRLISERDVEMEFTSLDGNRSLGRYRFKMPGQSGPLPFPEIRRNARFIRAYRDYDSRIADLGDRIHYYNLIQVTDTIRTLQPLAFNGDLRHQAIHSLVGIGLAPTSFSTRDDFSDREAQALHSFETSLNYYYPMQNLPKAFGGLADEDAFHHYFFEGKSETSDSYVYDDRYFQNLEIFSGNKWGAKLNSFNKRPNYSDLYAAARTSSGARGDWDTGVGHSKDGPYINKPDDGVVHANSDSTYGFYFGWAQEQSSTPAVFSPNRILPSAVMFGSLPTGVFSGRPWETLLFNPGPAAGEDHFSLKSEKVPDHLLLEFFHMPVVEPYAVSEPFSTGGRVNLNAQILPFDYIRRETGLHAVLAGQRVTIVPQGESYRNYNDYKGSMQSTYKRFIQDRNFRVPVDIDLTVEGIRQKYDGDGVFRFPSEICEIFLVPKGKGFSDYDENKLRDFWSDTEQTALSGDNVREKPYATIYPRLTTRSNTFRVHVRAELIQKGRFSEAATFDPQTDIITGEWRGSSLIERYVDPRNQNLVDYAKRNSASVARDGIHLDDLHAIRTLRTKRFAP
ncbi:MAG: Verru_Chthon cassette protein A [Verrucomicrobiota bacterium]